MVKPKILWCHKNGPTLLTSDACLHRLTQRELTELRLGWTTIDHIDRARRRFIDDAYDEHVIEWRTRIRSTPRLRLAFAAIFNQL